MSTYRLEVRRAEASLNRGTAWLLRPDLVATAFHVVGNREMRRWYHEQEGPGEVTYHLFVGDSELEMVDPASCNFKADVALLRTRRKLDGAPRLLLTKPPQRGSTWYARGYPSMLGTEEVTIKGTVLEIHDNQPQKAIELNVEVNASQSFSWRGLSGAAVCVEDRVIGVITNETGQVSLGWAAPGDAVRRLDHILQAPELVTACRDVLLGSHPDVESLANLLSALKGPQHAPPKSFASVETLAATVAGAAAMEGADGLMWLLREAEARDATRPEIALLRNRILLHIGRRDQVSRVERALEALRQLSTSESDKIGLALIEPLGFGARQVIDEVATRLRDQGTSFVPIRFALDPEVPLSTEQFHVALHRALLHDIPPEWKDALGTTDDDSLVLRFEKTVEALVDGPIRSTGRKLLFLVHRFSDLPDKQLLRWDYLLDTFSHRGIRTLVWGGRELRELCMGLRPSRPARTAQQLRQMPLGPLGRDEVYRLVTEHGGGYDAASVLHDETRGHPALVYELYRQLRGRRVRSRRSSAARPHVVRGSRRPTPARDRAGRRTPGAHALVRALDGRRAPPHPRVQEPARGEAALAGRHRRAPARLGVDGPRHAAARGGLEIGRWPR